MPRTSKDSASAKSAVSGSRRTSLLQGYAPFVESGRRDAHADQDARTRPDTTDESRVAKRRKATSDLHPSSPDPARIPTSKSKATIQTNASIAAQPALRAMSAVMSSQCPNDVSFEFLAVGKRLWTSQSLLFASAPYFEMLLSSDFQEGKLVEASASAQGTAGAPDDHDSDELDDSGAETDEHFYGTETPEDAAPAPNAAVPYKQIVVHGTAYTTYFAALLYFATGQIDFAPLRSSTGGSGSTTEEGTRLAALSQILQQAPGVPIPASPKSVYRLAHMIDCAELQRRALDGFSKQLSVNNVLAELFSNVAQAHPAIRDAALDYASKHWSKVSRTEQWEELKRSAANGALPATAAHTAMLLAERTPAKPARDLDLLDLP